jgi:hypothetical protein
MQSTVAGIEISSSSQKGRNSYRKSLSAGILAHATTTTTTVAVDEEIVPAVTVTFLDTGRWLSGPENRKRCGGLKYEIEGKDKDKDKDNNIA